MKSTTLQAPHGQTYYYGTGRRKKAIARVFLVPGTGKFEVNGREFLDYFPLKTLKIVVNQPFEATSTEGKFDIIAKVHGGGIAGQAGAIQLGISNALLSYDSDSYRIPLKRAGLLARDERAKERKKYGLKKARKAGQFSKR